MSRKTYKNSIPTVKEAIKFAMSTSLVTRNKKRTDDTQEIFTPYEYVDWLFGSFLEDTDFENPSRQFYDPTCGNGRFLCAVLINKIHYNVDSSFGDILSTIFGVDLEIDNVLETRDRLLCGRSDPKLIKIVNQHIVCADSLKYDETFYTHTEEITARLDLFDQFKELRKAYFDMEAENTKLKKQLSQIEIKKIEQQEKMKERAEIIEAAKKEPINRIGEFFDSAN